MILTFIINNPIQSYFIGAAICFVMEYIFADKNLVKEQIDELNKQIQWSPFPEFIGVAIVLAFILYFVFWPFIMLTKFKDEK